MVLIDDDILRTANLTEQEVKTELAVLLFSKGRLSYSQARRLAGVDRIAFDDLLFDYGVPSEFTSDDLEKDLQTIENLNLVRRDNRQ
ncbi:MAG: UPF0175 family protein [Saprospiraceae bacterium]